MFRAASFAAALGTALVSLMYLVNNVIPILSNLQLVAPSEAAIVLVNTIVPSLAWTILFLACWRAGSPRSGPRIAWTTLILAVALPMLYQAYQQVPYFSVLAIDSIGFLIAGVLLPLAWAVILIRMARGESPQGMALIAMLLTAISAIPEVLGSITALREALSGTLSAFWDEDPARAFWRLLATPVIRLLYWASQVFFLAALRRA